MNRKQFIQHCGATCRNWTWSWSLINHDEQRVIFGAWDTEREKERAVILREEWAYNHRNKKQPGYTQAIEHIRYIFEGYELFTFNMIGVVRRKPGFFRDQCRRGCHINDRLSDNH